MDRKWGAISLLCASDLQMCASRRDANCFNVSSKRDLHRSNNPVDIDSWTICVPSKRHMQFDIAQLSVNLDYGHG
jgi:hypothetical protein